MLDMGFVHDVKRVIAKLPAKRQTLFFSATMPKEIQQLADSILHEPVKVEVTPVSSTAETVGQQIFFVDKKAKTDLLVHLMQDTSIKTALVFSRTKHGADRIAKSLTRSGIRAAAIHGDKSQNARQNALSDFKAGKLRILVATDIAARGIDIDELGHVFNFDLPNVPETYVHRIGRTGRAGASGRAYSFCDMEEREYLRDIEKLIRKKIPVMDNHPFVGQVFSDNTRTAPATPSQSGQRPRSKPVAHKSPSRQGISQQSPSDSGRSSSSSGTWNRSAASGRNKSASGRPEFRQHAGANFS
jgi:ATP-dependent RNA helicase RhlE